MWKGIAESLRKGRALAGLAALALACGCVAVRREAVEVADVDGSGDHRIFRVGELTQVMMEPVLWRLEDSKIVNFDRPVTKCVNEYLPPEFEQITLRQLHEGKVALPRTLRDPWCLADLLSVGASEWAGLGVPPKFASRREFVRSLWDPRVRVALRRDQPGRSEVGYVLLMMAVTDMTGRSLEDLCREYLVEPYGLRDTTFAPPPGMVTRLAEPREAALPWLLWLPGPDVLRMDDATRCSRGLFTSAYDMLRVCYVVLPHMDRMRHLLDERELPCGRRVLCRAGVDGGCAAFVGFDPKDRRAALLLRNEVGSPLSDGLEMMERLLNPPQDLSHRCKIHAPILAKVWYNIAHEFVHGYSAGGCGRRSGGGGCRGDERSGCRRGDERACRGRGDECAVCGRGDERACRGEGEGQGGGQAGLGEDHVG
ncbi:MAG: beta-lactamase family protein [Kiritimatiellae bacterium]|nr:beta-lactamase family protein [Kiritimatiellia bacterium]